AAEQEVVAAAADREVASEARTGAERVVAVAALQDVVAVAAEQHVVAVAAVQPVVALEAVEAIVAAVAVHRVVADVPDELVIAGTAVDLDVLAGVVRIEEYLRAVHFGQDLNAAGRIADGQRGRAGQGRGVEDEVGRLEDQVHAAREVAVPADQLGEGVAFELEPEVETVRALQVVEAVAVLQILQ